MKKPLKAFILGAGFGTRLRPLTDSCPKVLLPYFGVPLLFILLEQLDKLDVEEIFVNGHYLSNQIRDAIKTYPLSKKISFYHEDEILGTSGPFKVIESKLSDCDLLVVNGDIISDMNLQNLVNKHQNSSAFATMGLLQNIPPEKTHVWCDEERILGFGSKNPSPGKPTAEYSFACAHVISPEFVRGLPNGRSEVIPNYTRFIQEGKRVSYLVSDPIWFDIGSPDAYFDAHMETLPLLGQSGFLEKFHLPVCWEKLGLKPIYSDLEKSIVNNGWNGPFFSKKEVLLSADSALGPWLVNLTDYDAFPKDTHVSNCLLLAGASIKQGDVLDSLILSGDIRISR